MRFLAIACVAGPQMGRTRTRVTELVRSDRELRIIIDDPRLLLIGSVSLPTIPLAAGQSALLGRVYDRGSISPMKAITRVDEEALVASRGRRLVERYWGGYVAILASLDERSVDVLRAPLGDLPCFFGEARGVVALGSDVDLLARAGLLTPAVEWAEVARHLAADDVRRDPTCLAGLLELHGGERLAIGPDGWRREQLWSPWAFADPRRGDCDPAEAAARVRDAVRASTRARLSGVHHPLLLLSGGIDSSILALCLGAAQRRTTALNLRTEDAAGDERDYARAAAGAAQIDLVESVLRVDDVDVRASDAARLPRPTRRSFQQAVRRLSREAAARAGADILIDGTGGDNVFCGLQSVTPVADLLKSGASLAAILATARSVASVAEVSLTNVIAESLRRAWLRPARTRWRPDLRFLSRAGGEAAAGAVDHAWLNPPAGALPGKAAHIALLVAGQSWIESLDPRDRPAWASPLLSQPVVEACLRLPSWMWFDEGRNRAIARRAFADRLPRRIATRRSKGAPDSFVHQIYEQNRSTVAEMLLYGRLAHQGLLDRSAIQTILLDPRPASGISIQRLMRLVDVEAWIDAWSGMKTWESAE